jgi:LmbE family N-acetylglucosaminyl deacetylase
MAPTGATGGGSGPSGLPGDLLGSGPVSINLPVPARVLAVGAHPDDIELGCGATLAKWASLGCQVHHLVLTDGSKGTWDPNADLRRLVLDRQNESRAAADIIDGHPGEPTHSEDRVLFLGNVDGELENTMDQRREVARIIRSLRPNVLFVHDPWRRYRLHPDHRAAGYLTLDAVVAARDPHFFPELGLVPHRPDGLLLYEPDQPNHVEDVRGCIGTKVDALLSHRTQWESTMGLAPSAESDSEPATTLQRTTLAAKINQQLADHGSLAELPAGEAFRLMTGP